MTEFNKWVGETTEAINVRLESIGDRQRNRGKTPVLSVPLDKLK